MKTLLLTLSTVFILGGCGQNTSSTQPEIDRKEEFSMKEKCNKIGKSYFEMLKKQEEYGIRTLQSPEYAYNESLNTCLIYFEMNPGELINGKHVYLQTIHDSMRQIILHSARKGFDSKEYIREFSVKKAELFQ